MIRRPAWLLAALLALAACTSTTTASRPSPSPSASITRSGYQAKANAICAGMNARGNSLQDPGTDQAKLQHVVDQAIPITADGLAQLRQLPEPKGDEATIEDYYAKLDKVIGDLRAESAALQANDRKRASEIAGAFKTDSLAANNAANAYGLTVCGSS